MFWLVIVDHSLQPFNVAFLFGTSDPVCPSVVALRVGLLQGWFGWHRGVSTVLSSGLSPSLSWLGAGYKQPLAAAMAVAALAFPGCVFLCLNRFAAPGQRGPLCATLGMQSHMVGSSPW